MPCGLLAVGERTVRTCVGSNPVAPHMEHLRSCASSQAVMSSANWESGSILRIVYVPNLTTRREMPHPKRHSSASTIAAFTMAATFSFTTCGIARSPLMGTPIRGRDNAHEHPLAVRTAALQRSRAETVGRRRSARPTAPTGTASGHYSRVPAAAL